MKNAQGAIAANHGQEAPRLETLFRVHFEGHWCERFRGVSETHGLARPVSGSGTRPYYRQNHLILHKSLAGRKIQPENTETFPITVGQRKACRIALHGVPYARGNRTEQ